jgi:hypothetical protein
VSKARKTVEVEKLKRWINGRLDSPTSSREQREELAHLLEHVLHETGNYRGFGYLPSETRTPGEPGYVFPNGEESEVLRRGYDETRRSYR